MKVLNITNYPSQRVLANKRLSFGSSRDGDNEFWEDSHLDDLRNHFLYFEAKAFSCVPVKMFSIKPEILSEEELNQLSFDYNSLIKLGIDNFTITADRKGVRGRCLIDGQHNEELKAVKQAGIDTIIDLRSPRDTKEYEKLCASMGLKYCAFPLKNNNSLGSDNYKSLFELIKALNRGNFYIACDEGINRTDIVLGMNYIFNPKAKITPNLESRSPIQTTKTIRKNANELLEQAEQSGEDTEQFLQKLGWLNKDKFQKKSTLRMNTLIGKNKNS